MRFAYPITLKSQRNGVTLVSFPDVPEALTEGASEQEALSEAKDCLVGALGGYISRGWAIPVPSEARGRPVVQLPPFVESKLAIYAAMCEQGMSPAALAMRLGKRRAWTDQLLDLDGHSPARRLTAALTVLAGAGSIRSTPPPLKYQQ